MSSDNDSDTPLFDEEVSEQMDHILSESQTNSQNGRISRPLLKTDLSDTQLAEQKRLLAEITTKTKAAEDLSDICNSAKQLSEQMDRQNKEFKSGGVNENLYLDAKCILANSSVSLKLVKHLEVDSKQFDALEFAEKLLTAVNPCHRIEDNDQSIDGQRVDPNDWIEFGRKYFHLHRVLPTFDFIHGSFDSTPDQSQPKIAKTRVKHQKTVLSAQTGATQIDPNAKVANDHQTPDEVELILKTIKKLEVKNSSLPFIQVVANPTLMSETVENIFHSAFLLKDGMVRMALDSDGGPVIESIDNSQIDLSEADKGVQSVFSFTAKDWKKWVEEFEITKPAIRHTKKT